MSKNDNHNLQAKCDLRRHFLRRYHSAPFTVFDCCQGDGLIWRKLRAEFSVSRYWGVDHKPKSGRLKIDSARVLEQGVAEDVIDVDTYGEPWKHWLAILKNLQSAATVFLTIGKPMPMAGGSRNLSRQELQIIGLTIRKIPPTLTAKLGDLAAATMLWQPLAFRIKIIECMEALNPGGNARYIGIRLEKSSSVTS